MKFRFFQQAICSFPLCYSCLIFKYIESTWNHSSRSKQFLIDCGCTFSQGIRHSISSANSSLYLAKIPRRCGHIVQWSLKHGVAWLGKAISSFLLLLWAGLWHSSTDADSATQFIEEQNLAQWRLNIHGRQKDAWSLVLSQDHSNAKTWVGAMTTMAAPSLLNLDASSSLDLTTTSKLVQTFSFLPITVIVCRGTCAQSMRSNLAIPAGMERALRSNCCVVNVLAS